MLRDSGEGQMGYWRRKASEWFRVISRAYESFPPLPCCHWWGWKNTQQSSAMTSPTTVMSRLWHFLRHPHWRTQCGGRSCRTLLPIPGFETKRRRVQQQCLCTSRVRATNNLLFLQTEHFLYFFLTWWLSSENAHLGRNDLSGPTAARLGSSLEEKQYFLLLWQPQAKHFLIGWKRHSSSAYVEKHEDLKKSNHSGKWVQFQKAVSELRGSRWKWA